MTTTYKFTRPTERQSPITRLWIPGLDAHAGPIRISAEQDEHGIDNVYKLIYLKAFTDGSAAVANRVIYFHNYVYIDKKAAMYGWLVEMSNAFTANQNGELLLLDMDLTMQDAAMVDTANQSGYARLPSPFYLIGDDYIQIETYNAGVGDVMDILAIAEYQNYKLGIREK